MINNYFNNFVMLVKSHLVSYPCPLQINSLWNFGFLLAIAIIIQLVTGILLAIFYCSDISLAFYSIYYLMREIFFGYLLRSFHANGASFVFLFAYIHLIRSLYYSSYLYNPNTFVSGIIIFLCLMAIAFMGYVLPFGQMSFWGATVITNLLSPFPNIVEYLSGGFSISNATTKRFFIFHFIMPFLVLGIVLIHLFYLHFLSSSNPLRYSTNNKIPFFPYLILKDTFSLFIVLAIYFIQCNFGLLTLSHPDNSLEANSLVTPAHIVPEWYFLIQYAMLKAIPNKNSGFIVLITSITIFLLLIEHRHFTTITTISYQSIFINYILLISLLLLFIGAQFPISIFISYARLFTFIYYFLVISIQLTLHSTHSLRSFELFN